MRGRPVILGAAGFVGRNLMHFLREYDPIGYDKNDWDESLQVKPDNFFKQDVHDMTEQQIPDGPFYVINLMAELGSSSEDQNIRNNLGSVKSLYRILNRKKDCLGIVHFSSISAAREISYYGKTKKASESTVINGSIPYIVLQSEMIIGEGARSIEKLKKALSLFPFVSFMPKGGRVVRYPIGISEVCELTYLVLKEHFFPNKIYHLVSEKTTMKKLAQKYTNKIIIPIPAFSLLIVAKMMEKIFKKPPFTYDNAVGVCTHTELTLDVLTAKEINCESL